jgi:hypothetical protein
MKFLLIGHPEIKVEGIWLTPEEYLKHEAYHPMVKSINGPRLFLAHPAGRGWIEVIPSYSTSFQLIEATPEEEVKLWMAGYRMLGLDRPGAQRCRFCNKAISDSDGFFGPRRWVSCHHTCNHEGYVLCPSCWIDKELKKGCPECGAEEVYC